MSIIIIAVLSIIFLLLWACLDIVPQAEARVIERLGVFHAVWNAGVHVKVPILDKAVVPHIDMREQILELPKIGYGNWEEQIASSANQDAGSSYYKKRHGYGSLSVGSDFGVGVGIDASGSANASASANALYGVTGVPSGEGTANANAGAGIGAKTNVGVGLGGYFTKLSEHETGRFNRGGRRFQSLQYYSNYRDVITKDNVRLYIDAAVFYQVTDPKQYVYGMKQPLFALQKLAVTTLRNIIGTLELDETLCSRDYINSKLRATLDEATDSWGIKITRVEIESIVPASEDIKDAMEKQAWAEREKRAMILIAEGNLRQRELEALGNKALNENAPNDAIIRLKAIQGMVEVSKGQATKIIIPSEMQGLVGLANGLTEGVTPGSTAADHPIARNIDQ